MFRKTRVLVIGDIMLDIYKYGQTFRISPEAPVPVVKVSGQSVAAGGAGNVAVNLRALGCHVELLGYIGSDDNGGQLKAELLKYGVIHSNLVESQVFPTISKTRIIVDGQYTLRYDDDSTLDVWGIGVCQTLSKLIHDQSFDIVIVSDYAKGTVTKKVMDILKTSFRGKIICDTKPVNAHLFKGVFCMVPNLKEALELVGVSSHYTWTELARKIKNRFDLEAVVITLSECGIFLLDQKNHSTFLRAHVDPDKPNCVLDVTGAGDTVISALAACIAVGYEMSEAVRISNLAASIVVRKQGTTTCSIKELLDENI